MKIVKSVLKKTFRKMFQFANFFKGEGIRIIFPPLFFERFSVRFKIYVT